MISTVAEEASGEDRPCQPTLRDMVMLEAPTAVKVSPGGRWVAFSIRTTNWKENRYDTACHVHDLEKGTTGATYYINVRFPNGCGANNSACQLYLGSTYYDDI